MADFRIKLEDENHAKCFSSMRDKIYDIKYDPETRDIVSNDNTAYFIGAVSYPMIAFLMLTKRLSFNENLLVPLKGIIWQDINKKFKNDYVKSVEYVLENLRSKSVDIEVIKKDVREIYDEVLGMKLKYSGKKMRPPLNY